MKGYCHIGPWAQADGEVELQDDWIQPTHETEPEDGGKVQNPAEGDWSGGKVPGWNADKDVKNHGPDRSIGLLCICIWWIGEEPGEEVLHLDHLD